MFRLSLRKLMLVIVTFMVCSGVLFANSKVPPIVSPEWLKSKIDNPKYVIIDLRKEDEFLASHVKNAVNIPSSRLFDDKKFMPPLDEMRKLFSNAGIDSSVHVIAYDDGVFIWSARLYWILQTLGHKNVSILDIGFKHKEIAKLPLSSTPKIAQAREFIPRVDNTKLQTKLGTLVSIGKKTIIDGRKESHYKGLESKAKRFGHIPTAQNYACTQNYEIGSNGNKMKNLKELAAIYKDLPKDKEIILYCDGGSESALNYIVLQELGYKVSVYDGSWLEWGNDMAVPVENPSGK